MTPISPRMQRRVAELEASLSSADHYAEADTFSAVAERFMDLADDPRLLQISQPTDTPELLKVLKLALVSMLNRPVTVMLPMVLAVPSLGFRHGALVVDGLPCMFFHFAGSGRGLLSYHGSDGITRATRFTAVWPAQGDES